MAPYRCAVDNMCHLVAQLGMRRVLKTRYFARWMRKTELSDEALCSAVVEMAQGLIDADLGVVNGVGPEHWLRPTREIHGFLCMVLKK